MTSKSPNLQPSPNGGLKNTQKPLVSQNKTEKPTYFQEEPLKNNDKQHQKPVSHQLIVSRVGNRLLCLESKIKTQLLSHMFHTSADSNTTCKPTTNHSELNNATAINTQTSLRNAASWRHQQTQTEPQHRFIGMTTQNILSIFVAPESTDGNKSTRASQKAKDAIKSSSSSPENQGGMLMIESVQIKRKRQSFERQKGQKISNRADIASQTSNLEDTGIVHQSALQSYHMLISRLIVLLEECSLELSSAENEVKKLQGEAGSWKMVSEGLAKITGLGATTTTHSVKLAQDNISHAYEHDTQFWKKSAHFINQANAILEEFEEQCRIQKANQQGYYRRNAQYERQVLENIQQQSGIDEAVSSAELYENRDSIMAKGDYGKRASNRHPYQLPIQSSSHLVERIAKSRGNIGRGSEREMDSDPSFITSVHQESSLVEITTMKKLQLLLQGAGQSQSKPKRRVTLPPKLTVKKGKCYAPYQAALRQLSDAHQRQQNLLASIYRRQSSKTDQCPRSPIDLIQLHQCVPSDSNALKSSRGSYKSSLARKRSTENFETQLQEIYPRPH